MNARCKAVLAGAIGGSFLLVSATSYATMPMQKKAKELGIKGVENCQSCHNEKLPKKDAVTNNERGKWLVDEKDKRKAKEVDVAWLKDYVEKK
jgi:mono/diheme cytochrome c family protein